MELIVWKLVKLVLRVYFNLPWYYCISYTHTRLIEYRKIPKISPGAYIFQRPFLRGLILEGLIFGGAYLWREIDWASLTVGSKFTVFALFYFVFEGNFPVQPPGCLYFEGQLNGGFFPLRVSGAYIWRGLFSEFYGISNIIYNWDSGSIPV